MKQIDFKHTLILTTPILIMSIMKLIYAKPYPVEETQLRRINTPHTKTMTVQIGTFRSIENALQFKAKWSKLVQYPIQIKHIGHLYQVIVGPIPPSNIARFESSSSIQPISQPIPTTKPIAPAHNQSTNSRWFNWSDQKQYTTKNNTVSEPKTQHRHNPVLSSNTQNTPALYSTPNIGGSWYIGIDAGLLKPQMGSTILVNNGSDFNPPMNTDNFSTQSTNHTLISAEVGRFWKRNNKILPGYALGLRYQHLLSNTISGRITQYSEPLFDNYTYHWSIQADVISAYTKLQIAQWGPIMPYVNGGVGTSFNRSGAYSETADTDVTERISPAFTSSSATNFAYDIGLGVDFAVNSQIIVSLGYDFQNIGPFSSGPGVSTWSGERLKLGSTNVNTGLIGLTYLFDNKSNMK